MSDDEISPTPPPRVPDLNQAAGFASAVWAAVLCWVALSAGFIGLKELMRERPQFVGQPMSGSKVTLVQRSPQIVVRKLTDNVSVIKPTQPLSADVRFDMAGHRDYRGLKTVVDMSGTFTGEYHLTNTFAEPVFVLFRCPHPQADGGATLQAAGLKLTASTPGLQESVKGAWLWTGRLDAHGSAKIEISYQAASLKAVQHRVEGQGGSLINKFKIAFNRQGIPALRVESGEGAVPSSGDSVVWERKDFLGPDHFTAEIVEGRNLFTSLTHLMEIGPLVSLMFLLSAGAVILTRQKLTPVQVLTIGACYALYFPLILYLSARFTFPVALVVAVVVPGSLLLNYARWLLGPTLGLLGGAIFIGLYEIFPTLAAFAGWNRGMVLLSLGVVTLAVLINLQNRALKQSASAAAALLLFALSPATGSAAEVQVVLPGELASSLLAQKREAPGSLLSFSVGAYQVRHETNHFEVEAQIPFQAVRPGEAPVLLFGMPVHLQESRVEPAESKLASLVTVTNRLGLFVQGPGAGTLRLRYRAPIEMHEGKKRAKIPLVAGASSNMRLQSFRSDLEIQTGSLWGKNAVDKLTHYELGAAGEESLLIEWREDLSGLPIMPTDAGKEFYGIGLTRSQNLTVIHSDGSCTHFVELELPAFQQEEFRMRLPADSRLISVSVDGAEIPVPRLEDRLCRVRLPERDPQRPARYLSFRLSYPQVSLGFIGSLELHLPELFQTTGALDWSVALPNGFDTQVLSSGLDLQKTSSDLTRFGDYGRVLKSHPQTYLAKTLAPPGIISLNLKYRQLVPGMIEP